MRTLGSRVLKIRMARGGSVVGTGSETRLVGARVVPAWVAWYVVPAWVAWYVVPAWVAWYVVPAWVA